ncbi:diguanylate cyclase domain-containing protein [Eoetvoesiella caeni]
MQSSPAEKNNAQNNGPGTADLFEVSPTSMWLEDYSGLRELFNEWRAAGVTDLRSHLLADLSRVGQCSANIKVLRVNQRALDMYAASSFEDLTSKLDKVFRDDMYEAHVTEMVQLWEGRNAFESTSVNYALNGRRIDILLKGVVLPGHEQDWERVLVVMDDITELEDARRRLQISREYAAGLFQYAPVSLWVEDFSAIKDLLEELRLQGITDFRTFTDVHPEFVERCMSEIRVLDVNEYTLGMFKASSQADLLSRLPEVFREEMRPYFREQLIDLWEGRLLQHREVLNYALDGSAVNIHLQFSVFSGHEEKWDLVLLALTDITARKKAEAYLEYLGKHDVLTKLKNRSFYVDELNRLERKNVRPVSVVIIDLNQLKETNDSLGHAIGDGLLQRTGEILTQAVDKPFQPARIGGDEFAILLPGVDADGCEALINSIHELIELNNQFYNGPPLNLSIGWATCTTPGKLDDALRTADLNMYQNKRQYYENAKSNRRNSKDS